MIKVELTVDELDYGSLVEQFLPELAEKLRASGNPVGMLLSNGMPAAMAKGIVAAAEKGIRLRVESVRAEAKAK